MRTKTVWPVLALVLWLVSINTVAAAEPFRDCPQCPEMISLPAGVFQMGSPVGEKGRWEEETQHKVTIPKPFAMGRFEVTFEEWDACTLAGACPAANDAGWGRARRPVVNVSWRDAKVYVEWLAKQTGKAYRLPTEAEWEYAARAGEEKPRYWGVISESACQYANVGDLLFYQINKLVEYHNCNDQFGDMTAPVGSFKPNPFGLYDVLGNVWEWVEDCYGDYDDTPRDGTAYDKARCKERVVRGGGWYNSPAHVRSAKRLSYKPDKREEGVGLRVALSLP